MSLSAREHPTPTELNQFERDPAAALLSLAMNSGANRYASIPQLYGAGATVDDNNPAVQSAIDTILADLLTGFDDPGGKDHRERIHREF